MPTSRRPIPAIALALLAIALVLQGCRGAAGPAGEVELAALRANVAAYEEKPSEEQAARVEASFAELDAEIAQLNLAATTDSGASAQATKQREEALAKERYELRNRYAKAIVAAKAAAAGDAVRSLGAEIGRGLQAAGKSLEGAAEGDGDKPAAE